MNFLVVQVLPTMTASIGSYTFLIFALANMIFLPFIWIFYPETTGRTLEELDVLFAHAHITQRRPTIVAAELPKLTDHQVHVMTERYDIHGGALDNEAGGTFGDAPNAGTPDTTLPPADPGVMSGATPVYGETEGEGRGDGLSTRVGSFDADTAVNKKGGAAAPSAV